MPNNTLFRKVCNYFARPSLLIEINMFYAFQKIVQKQYMERTQFSGLIKSAFIYEII